MLAVTPNTTNGIDGGMMGAMMPAEAIKPPERAFWCPARTIIGRDDFIEIFVNAPLDVCEDRDIKGLYSKARRGEIREFTGITSPFETPQNADIEIRTDLLSIEESVKQILEFVLPRIEFGNAGME